MSAQATCQVVEEASRQPLSVIRYRGLLSISLNGQSVANLDIRLVGVVLSDSDYVKHASRTWKDTPYNFYVSLVPILP